MKVQINPIIVHNWSIDNNPIGNDPVIVAFHI